VTQAEDSADGIGPWLFHVSPAVNRASIRDRGLQPTASGGRGLIGPPSEDTPGIFVCEDREEAEWIADNLNPALVPVDIWRFSSRGVHLVPSDHGFLAATTSVEPSQLELIEADRMPSMSTLTRVFRALRQKLAR
jgi:hypothetical protein